MINKLACHVTDDMISAISGNNHLGGQDFNERLFEHVQHDIKRRGVRILKSEELQSLRQAVEKAKLELTSHKTTLIKLQLGNHKYNYNLSRETFEKINGDLFEKVLEPIVTVLASCHLDASDVDEIVLVGGSTRIPKVRQIITQFFNKELNTEIDPELAVVSGVSIQAGILGGMWPLTVSAIELPVTTHKIHLN